MSSAAEEWRAKRRRRQLEREQEETSGIGGEGLNNSNDNDVSSSLEIRPTAAKRLRQEREEALRLMNAGSNDASGAAEKDDGNANSVANARMRAAMSRRALASVGSGGGKINNTDEADRLDDVNDGEKDAIDHQESSNHRQHESSKDKESNNNDDDRQEKDDGENEEDTAAAATSLLQQAALLKKQHQNLSNLEQAALQRREDEERILKEASHVQTNALQAASELAEGVKYKSSLPTGWRCPNKILKQGENEWEKIRKKWHILVEGEECPPPIRSFRDMGYPKPILDVLAAKNVRRPTPIQMQGLTVALSGRDMVG